MKSKYLLQLLTTLSLLILTPNSYAANRNVINSLPGYPGKLPFDLETGYIGVGVKEEVQLFYYFIESESDPQRDPLMLWLTGGPGCSAFSGLTIEIGPLNFNDSAFSWQSEIPRFQLNPYSWTKVASIIFLDAPVGTGFSYSTTLGGYYSDDISHSWHIYQFLRQWLIDHVEFKKNPLYIAGDSYCGKIVPIVVENILNGNKLGLSPKLNLKGYVLGNPYTQTEDLIKAKLEYAERVSLLSGELYEVTRKSCNGSYEIYADNVECKRNLQETSNVLDPLFDAHVLKPTCLTPQTRCQEYSYELLNIWANKVQVQEALHIRQGSSSYIAFYD